MLSLKPGEYETGVASHVLLKIHRKKHYNVFICPHNMPLTYTNTAFIHPYYFCVLFTMFNECATKRTHCSFKDNHMTVT